MFGRRNYVIEVLYDCGAIGKIVLRNKTKKEIAKAVEYYKSKAYWYDEMRGIMLIMKTNQPV